MTPGGRMASKLLVSILVSVVAYCSAARGPAIHNGVLPSGGKIWALLVAGSNGYMNYRHQADICHAYQILRSNGIPEENIITMMYDDVARAEENPTPGIIINKPDGPNVYEGVKIDYKGKDVNPDTFMAVLQGNTSAVRNKGTGRVLQSGPRDHVFVNFADHGAPGLLCFPDETLLASRLETAFKSLASRKKYSKMVWYVEACESGSMFDDILPDNMNIMVLTAADPRESSYACYYDETRQTYLGDVFSVKWMEDADVEDLSKETIHHQYEIIRTETNTSHVEEYGDLDVGSMVLSMFLGDKNAQGKAVNSARKFTPITDAVNSRDVPVKVLYKKLKAAGNGTSEQRDIQFQIHQMQKYRRTADSIMNYLVRTVAKGDNELVEEFSDKKYNLNRRNLRCYEQSVQYFEEKCFKIPQNPYLGKHLFKFINMCSTKKTHLKNIRAGIDVACKGNVITGVA